ncbi:hypothetical protein CA267_005255 [Alteromonas pelagimontana]|uniref:Tetratricopeptide repeat protein n=1 Tax=Alteromonas pelagimontana TaxID=1858656 RepID=A0A6M4MAM7_9ALTE|nr:hypothetical protein [Alteromonas pelagimontana]QJR80223.1 hypothetical protein CA267_005255 [Alteromonas pelagimontana]
MTQSPFQSDLSVNTDKARQQASALTQLLRVAVACVALGLSVLCLQFGTAYLTAQHSEATVSRWFKGLEIPAATDIELMQKNLESVSEILPSDAGVELALARLYLLRGQAENSEVFYEAARTTLNDIRLAQPTHFQPLALLVLLDDMQNIPIADAMPNIEKALSAGAFEKETQLTIGPLIVKKWQHLSAHAQELAGPFVKSALREEDTKQRMYSAMREYALVTPFLSYSSNKKTSAELREMASSLMKHTENATYR